MKKNVLEFWVGVFVLLGMAALGVLSFRVAGGNGGLTGNPTYALYAEFSDIGGLKANAPIRTAGVVVGRVESITLDPETYQAKVTLKVNNQYKFSTDVSAQILTSGLLGEQYIGLTQGADEAMLNAGDTITETSSAMVLENLINQFVANMGGDKKSDDTAKPEAVSQ